MQTSLFSPVMSNSDNDGKKKMNNIYDYLKLFHPTYIYYLYCFNQLYLGFCNFK